MAKKNEHTVTLNYKNRESLDTFQHLMGMMLFSPYQKGIEYHKSKELTAKIIPMQLLLGDEFEKVWNQYLDLLNDNLVGLGKLFDTIDKEMQKLGTGKYKINIKVEKI